MSDPRNQLETVIQTAINSSLKELHTCLPGVIQKFTASTQLADIQPMIPRMLKGELVNLPLLVDVPIRFFKCANFSITLPMQVDDHVLLIFSERCIDNFLINGKIESPNDIRKHSLSDAFAIPMMFSQPEVITDFDPDNIQIRNTDNDTYITITTTGNIELNGNADSAVAYTDLKSAFDTLRSDLNNLITAYNLHIHVTTATIGSSATPGVISPTASQGTPSTADMSGAEVPTVKVP